MKTLIKNLINKIVKSEESPFPKGHKDGYWVFENGINFLLGNMTTKKLRN